MADDEKQRSDRRLYTYDVDGERFHVWVVSPSREAADAVMYMEYTGMRWGFYSERSFSMLPHQIGLVDHWVGGGPNGD